MCTHGGCGRRPVALVVFIVRQSDCAVVGDDLPEDERRCRLAVIH